MEMTYDGALVMPSSDAVMDEDEMMYLEGGLKVSTWAIATVWDAWDTSLDGEIII